MGNELREVVRQIKDQANIVDVVGRTVQLKKLGASYKGSCPFHQEKTPSFNVLPAKGMYYCFGCGAGGDVINYVMQIDHLEFMEAVEKLARELGIEMPARGSYQSKEEADQEKRLQKSILSANEAALVWFRQNLLKNRSRAASEYLPERGIEDALSEKFQLGAALDEWNALRDHLVRAGFSESLLVEAGLCVRSERGTVYDRFRNRLIFPIMDANGRAVGFGGRLLGKDDKAAKYYNSAETPVYKKSNILYALNLAKESIHKSGFAIVCEGYMDVLMAHAHGFDQAVASLGTALTRQQARLLKRFANRTYFLYDGDVPGQNAMLRGGEPLLEAGFDVRVITLPEEDDPDTFLRREGAARLSEQMDGASEFFDFALRTHEAGLDLNTLAGQAELVERLAPTLVALKNDVMREGAIMRVLKRLGGLPREALNQILDKKRKELERQRDRSTSNTEETAKGSTAPSLDKLEKNLLKLIIESPEALEIVRLELHSHWIRDPRLQEWIFYLYDRHEYLDKLIEDAQFDPEFTGDMAILYAIRAWECPLGSDTSATARELLRRIHERYQVHVVRDLLRRIDEKEIQGESATKILAMIHHENRMRFEQSGRFLRTKDFNSHGRRTGGAI